MSWIPADMENFTDRQAVRVLGVVLALQISFLTLTFSLLHPNLQIDSIEILYFSGMAGGWKHPFLPVLFLKLGMSILPNQVWSYYLVGQIALCLTYLFVWLLAREMLPPLYALLATIILASGLYYSFYSLTYNHNSLTMTTWAGFTWCFWKALDDRWWRWWVALGVAAAAALSSKYTSVLLFTAAFVTMLLVPKCRGLLRTPKPYVAVAIAVLLVLPHFLWVAQNDWTTFRYALQRISTERYAPFFSPAYFALRFTYGQVLNMFPVVLSFVVLVGRKTKSQETHRKAIIDISTEKALEIRYFLLAMLFIPFALTVVLSVSLDRYVHSLWGLHYWSLAGIALFYFFKDRVKVTRIKWFSALLCFFVIATTAGVLSLPFFSSPRLAWIFDGPYQVDTKPTAKVLTKFDVLIGRVKSQQDEETQTGTAKRRSVGMPPPPSLRMFFGGAYLTREIERRRAEKGYGALSIVAGNMWIAGNVAFFSLSRPLVFHDFNERYSQGMTFADFRERGGAIFWDAAKYGEKMPMRYREALRGMVFEAQSPIFVPWRRILGQRVRMIQEVPLPLVGWAIVPPQAR